METTKTEVRAEAPNMTETMKYITERSENLARFSDKLSRAIESIELYFEKIAPVAGVRFSSKLIFYEDPEDEYNRFYCLAILNEGYKGWGLKVLTFDCDETQAMWTRCRQPRDESRRVKKEIIKALPGFMAEYAEALKKYEKEYQDISDKAEKMVEVLKTEEEV